MLRRRHNLCLQTGRAPLQYPQLMFELSEQPDDLDDQPPLSGGSRRGMGVSPMRRTAVSAVQTAIPRTKPVGLFAGTALSHMAKMAMPRENTYRPRPLPAHWASFASAAAPSAAPAGLWGAGGLAHRALTGPANLCRPFGPETVRSARPEGPTVSSRGCQPPVPGGGKQEPEKGDRTWPNATTNATICHDGRAS